MSDSAPVVAAESSAPSSSAEIAASVVESAESNDTGTGGEYADSSESRIDTTNIAEVSEPAAPTQAELSAAAKFLLKQGHQNKRSADGRDTRLPYGTVEKMLDRYAEEHRTTWQTEKQTIESKAQQLERHLETLKSSVAGDPRAYLEDLANYDARYRAFLEPQKQTPAPAAADDPEPMPDYPLGDGNYTYSKDGLDKWRQWSGRQLKRELAAEMDERLKPLAEREKAEKARAEQEQAFQAVYSKTQDQLKEAQSWPLFGPLAADGQLTEFQQAVLDELKKDSDAAKAAGKRPTLTFEGAYIKVASPRMTEDDATRRARLLKEINGAPRNPALSRQTADTVGKPAGPRSSVDVARQVIAKLEAGG